MYKLSKSSLETMKQCKRCFWWALKKGIKRPAGISSSLPNGIDKLLKKHFDSSRINEELPPELEKKGITARLFPDLQLLNIWRNNFKGAQYFDKKGNMIRAVLDDLLIHNGKLIVLDFKTRGFDLKEDTNSFYQDQMNLYAYVLWKLGYDVEEYAYLLYYISDGISDKGEILFETKLEKMKINLADADRLIREALKVLDGEEPPEKGCDYCISPDKRSKLKQTAEVMGI